MTGFGQLLALCLLHISVVFGQDCTSEGFFRNPRDCAKFIRCVPLGNGPLQAYYFDCPAGTVFDEGVSVCNFPWAAPPCEPQEQEAPETVIVTPTFNFECTAEGFFAHDSNCQQFWLCRDDDTQLTPLLYNCPEGFLYHDSIRRCLPKDQVNCNKTPDLGRISLDPEPIQLYVQDLPRFYSLFNY